MLKEIELDALVDNLSKVTPFVTEIMESAGASLKALTQMELCVEEIFVNIAHYAYQNGIGKAKILCDTESIPGCIVLEFRDRGVPFNPLAKEDADVTLSASERPIGGLGIFLTKKFAREMHYKYENGENVLTLVKELK